MAKAVEKITLFLKVKGFSEIKSLGKELEKLKTTVDIGEKELDQFVNTLREIRQETTLSKNAFKGQLDTLNRVRDSVGIGTRAYDLLGKEIDQVRASMNALNASGKKQTFFGKVGLGGKAAAGAAIGSVGARFLPAGAATGASVGALAGGVPGAITGAAIGLTVDAAAGLVGVAKTTAEYSAQIKRLEVALKGVTKSQKEFNKAQKVIKSVSQELNVPIAAATQQFTTLTASVVGAGGSVDEAEKVFRGVSEAIKATGGDAEDVKSAIRAMSQIFGKGKVSAEELQGQLGERLPGAVTKFAAATGRTLPQLQKDLRDGTVGLNDVMKFVVRLSEDHSEAAKAMAASSADAGQRMQVTFDELKKNVGDILQPLGAEIQNMTDVSVDNINRLIKAFKNFFALGEEFELQNLQREAKRLEKGAMKFGFSDVLDALSDPTGISLFREAMEILASEEIKERDRKRFFEIQKQIKAIEKRNKGLKEFSDLLKLTTSEDFNFDLSSFGVSRLNVDTFPNAFAQDGDGNVFQDPVSKDAAEDTKKARDILDKYRKSVKQVNQDIANSFVNTFKKLEDALVEFVQTGTLNFKKLAQSIIADITRIFIRSQIIAPLTGGLGNIFNPKPKTPNPFTMDFGGTNFGSFSDYGNLLSKKPSPGDILPSLNKSVSNTLFPDGLPKSPGFKNFADGGVIPKNKIVPYAKGGLITRPQLFPLADGAAIAGEAGVEAIMPLRRGRNGRLGVEANGGGIGNITVNVDASGSSVEGNENDGRLLGEAIALAIQSKLIEEKRPGGLLA